MAEEQKNTATAVENPPEAPLEEGQDNFAILEEAAHSYLPPEDVERVKEAYRFALSHHRGQKRKSGEPYINHPVEVAIILAKTCTPTRTHSARGCFTTPWRTPTPPSSRSSDFLASRSPSSWTASPSLRTSP